MLIALSLSLSAIAGPIDTCYADAESNHTGLTISVATGSTTQMSGSDLDAFFDAVAEHHQATDLSVSHNSAGKAAIQQAMNCLLANDKLTLSSIVVNERFSELSVRPATITVYEGTVAAGNLVFDSVAASCSADAALRFIPAPSSTTSRELLVNGAARLNDIEVNITLAAAERVCPGSCPIEGDTCAGVCWDIFETPAIACMCGSGDGCGGSVPKGFTPDPGSMARATY